MSWAKLDDRYDDNRKIKRAWRRNRAAVGLHAMAITYCSRHNTDGIVDIDWLEERLPTEKEREKVLSVLVETGLFEPIDAERWHVHDYLEFNASRQSREDASRAAREAALVRWARTRDADRNATGNADRIADGNAEAMRDPMPPPARPSPAVLKAPKPPRDGIEEKAAKLGFDEWLDDHHAVTGKTVPAAGTKTRASLAAAFVACCAEVPDDPPLPALKLATRAAHADPHRIQNGYDGAENVLRSTKILNLVDNGRRQSRSPNGSPSSAEIVAAQRRAAERKERAA